MGLVFHNGISYDIPLLERYGFEVRGLLVDTMWLAHHCYSELPKGLQFLATQYCWAPVWKSLVDEKDEGDEAKA